MAAAREALLAAAILCLAALCTVLEHLVFLGGIHHCFGHLPRLLKVHASTHANVPLRS